MTVGGTRDELALCALGLEALAQRLDVVGRARPKGMDRLRRDLSAVLSRQDASSRDGAAGMADGEVEMGPLLLTFDEAAERLRTSRSTVERAVRAGALGAVHLGRNTRIRPADLEAFAAALPKKAGAR